MEFTTQQSNPVEQIFQFASGYMTASCLSAVTRLGIADLLQKGPKNITQLAKETSTIEDALYRVMRALVSIGVFVETDNRTFANSPVSEILRSDHPNSLRDMVIWIANAFHFETYSDMLPTLRDGKTAIEHIYHKAPFDVIFSDSDLARVFSNAMTSISAMVVPAVMEAYEFPAVDTLADIAGGHGFVITAIVQKYPGMKGILFDLPQVISGARERIKNQGLSDRIELESGDFFRGVPAADAYVMKHIIHDWDDERAATILTNCGAHLPRGGKVILLESVLPESNEPHMAKWGDIEMMMLPGGRERTEKEYRDLFASAGFHLNRIVHTKSPLSVIEAEKRE